ncbi:MAG: type II secretion system protein [Burkholderiaceae bacterium]|nr:type II secretion system protein [Burkholderiaceae bacterium]
MSGIRCWPAARGFTLLELLVVMALVAMVLGLVGPASMRAIDAAQERGIAADLEAALSGLPLQAFRSGQELTLDGGQIRQLVPDLPSTWDINLDRPLRYGSSGMAAGGQVTMRVPGRAAMRWHVTAVTGDVRAVSP